MRDRPWQLLALGLLGLFLLPLGGGLVFAGAIFGQGLVDGTIEDGLVIARVATMGAWVFVVGFGGYRAYSIALQPDRLGGMLTTVSHRELIAGLVLAELLLWGAPVGIIGGLIAMAYAAGTGSILAGVALALVVAFGTVTGLLGGFALALSVRNLGVRSVTLTRLRNTLLGLLFLAYIGVLFSGTFNDLLSPLLAVLSPTPVGWYAHLLLAPVTPAGSSVLAIGAIGASLVGIALLGLANARLAAWLWYADGVSITHESSGDSSLEAWLRATFPRPVAGVAIADLRRARRSPIALSFALYPLILLVGPLTETVQTGTVTAGFPIWVLLCGAWIAGVLFTLNPLGNEAPVLSVSVLSPRMARGIVGGHVLAGVLIAGPPTVIATVALGIASPHSTIDVALLAVYSAVLLGTAVTLAPGIGVTFPRFEEVSITSGTKAIVPSWVAFGAFSTVLIFVALPGSVGLLLGSGLFRVAGVGGTATLGVGVGFLSTRWAVRRLDAYEMD